MFLKRKSITVTRAILTQCRLDTKFVLSMIQLVSFSMTLFLVYDPDFKGTPLFNVEYLGNDTR